MMPGGINRPKLGAGASPHAKIEMTKSSPVGGESAPPPARAGLFLKYVVMFAAIVILALAINGVSDIWFSYHEQQNLLFRIQREQAKSAADKIEQFLNEITTRIGVANPTVLQRQYIRRMAV